MQRGEQGIRVGFPGERTMRMQLEQAGLSPGEVRRLTGATRGRLRYWEANGHVSPSLVRTFSRTYRRYDAAQLERVRKIMALIAEGFTLAGAVRRLDAEAGATLGKEMETPQDPQATNADNVG